jgi:isoleucyl-tRNA synthetase
MYAHASNFDLSQSPPISERPLMDRWIYSDLQELTIEVDSALGAFDSQRAGKALATFIDDLSNWYVRRSRRRFWEGDNAALATLHECLHTLTLLMAPMVPFISESVWQELIRPVDPSAAESVHLADFPIADTAWINKELSAQVALTRRIVELGRAARAESSIKIRQPLGRALIAATGWSALPNEMKEQIAEELNVIHLEDIADADGDLVDISVKANFRTLGAKFGAEVQQIAQSIAATSAVDLVATIRREGQASTSLGEKEWVIDHDDLVITETPRQGWTVISHGSESVALDLTLTKELIAAGNVREVVRSVQESRKSEGFDISDRIHLRWNSNDEVADAIQESHTHIANEVLALEMTRDTQLSLGQNDLGFTAVVSKAN